MLSSVQHRFFSLTRNNTAIGVMGAFSFAVLTSIGAILVIPLPFTPVPITLQTYFVLASGILLGRKFGALSQVFYLLFGTIGFLQFAGGRSGIEIVFGATGGYLFGFIFSSFLVGWFSDLPMRKKTHHSILGFLLGTSLVYVCGILGLILVLRIDLFTAMLLGFFPFLPGDLIKVLMAFGTAKLLLPEERHDHNDKRKTIQMISIIISFIMFASFVLYLFSNRDLPPASLPFVSLLLTSLIGLTLYLNMKN